MDTPPGGNYQPPPSTGEVPPAGIPPAAPPPTQPQDVGMIRVFVLVALITNALATVFWIASTVVGGLASCGIGCLFIFVPAITAAAVAFDAVTLNKMNQPPSAGVASALQTSAIGDIIAGVVGMSFVPLVMGILILVFLQKPEVSRYYHR